jgi:LmbE family N-acetylglucosaminyl deacetylase
LNIAAIFCFPLDLEITSFGTLSKFSKAGHQVHVVIVGNGISLWTRKYKQLLYESCRKVHVNNILFTDKFDYTSVTQDNALVINSFVSKIIPELVIIPFWKSYNDKYNVLSRTSLIACRGIPNILMYNFNKETKFNPNIQLTLSHAEASAKLDVLLAYWPLINRKFFSNGQFSRRTLKSQRQRNDDQIATYENIKQDISSFLCKRVNNQMSRLLEASDGKKNRLSKRIKSQFQPQSKNVAKYGDLSEVYESHRVSLV